MSLLSRLGKLEQRCKKLKPPVCLMVFAGETEMQVREWAGLSKDDPIEFIHFDAIPGGSVDAKNLKTLENISFKGTML